MIDLTSYAANVYSQNGEDGILEALFAQLNIESGTFCEFGAWDGKYLSNTYRLFERGWRGWYIEGNPPRYRQLRGNIAGPDVELICAYVTLTGGQTLDHLLMSSRLYSSGLVDHLDLLSIDIDSDDLAVWRSFTLLRSKVVVIECNPTIPPDVHFENPVGKNQGNSTRAIYEFARSIGYQLVGATACNLIFLDEAVGEMPFSVLDLSRPLPNAGARYFFGYDGALLVASPATGTTISPTLMRVPWNGAVFAQPVGKVFRQYDEHRLVHAIGVVWSLSRALIGHPKSGFRECAWVIRSRRTRRHAPRPFKRQKGGGDRR